MCTDCPVGTYADVTGLYRCKLCPPGTFGKDTGRVVCEACEFGKNTFNSNQTVCSQCREGTFSGGGYSTVREWLLGVFLIAHSGINDKFVSFVMLHCTLIYESSFGYRCDVQCLGCAAGTVSSPTIDKVTGVKTGETSEKCDPCGAGTYNPSKYQWICRDCDNAQWAPNRSSV